jgi:hypothetical protein
LTDFACLDVKVTGTSEICKPHFLQNDARLEFLELQAGHFLCFRFFFSSVKVTVNRSFSSLKFSSGIQAISVLHFLGNRNNDRTASALSRKYSLEIELAFQALCQIHYRL